MSLRIAISQMDPVVGSFEANVKQIQEAYERACSMQARLLLTPELGVCGYPPHDLLTRPEMLERSERALSDLIAMTRGKKCAVAVGHVSANPLKVGRALQNTVSVLEGGKQVFRQAKSLLPTYDVFDEARYFEPAQEIKLWDCGGTRIAVGVCEDLWAHDPSFGRSIYRVDPVEEYKKQKAQLVLALSASPYEWGKRERRESLHREAAKRVGAPLIYVNQMSATDEILFDGGSFVMDSGGKLIGRLPVFKTSFGLVELSGGSVKWESPASSEREDEAPEEVEILTRALVTGIREYFARTKFKTAIIGLSGGIDSAVVAVLAAKAIGARSVLGVAMPSQYSSGHSLEDAEILARNLGCGFEVRPIKFLFSTASRELSEGRGKLADIAAENLQSRLRGTILMTLANHYNALVLTTGNKSELATGYCTQYGDMVGAIAPLGDVFKTRVYELARHMNKIWGGPIPDRSLTKPPSAELKPGQTDQDTLPPYDVLDAMLEEYLERAVPVDELEKKHAKAKGAKSADWVRETLRRVEINEYKRRQAAPVLKVSPKAFGIGRRIPVAKVWDQK